MRRGVAIVLGLVLAAVAAPAGALAAPEDDFAAVYADWQADGRITPCHFTEAQLESAYAHAQTNPDLAYSEFPSAVEREIVRWRAGRCASVQPEPSPLRGVRIVRVSGRGGAARERVVLRNAGRRAVRLGRARIASSGGGSVRLPRGIRLAPRASLTVHVGCASGRRRPSVRRGHAYACARRALFADRGDVATLLDARGIAVSRRAFGNAR